MPGFFVSDSGWCGQAQRTPGSNHFTVLQVQTTLERSSQSRRIQKEGAMNKKGKKPDYCRAFPRVKYTYERSLGKTTLSSTCIALYQAAAFEWGWHNVCELYGLAVEQVTITVGAKQLPCDLTKYTIPLEHKNYIPTPKWSLKPSNPINDRETGFQLHKNVDRFLERLCNECSWSKAGFYRWALERWILHSVQSDIRRCLITDHVSFTKKWRNAA